MRRAIICIGLVLLAASSPSANQFFGFQGRAGRAQFTGFNQAPFYTGHSGVRPKQR